MVTVPPVLKTILFPFNYLGDAINVLGLPHRELITFSFHETLTAPTIPTCLPRPSPVREVRAEDSRSSQQVLPTPSDYAIP
jgi:hypothetical protein